MAQPISLFLGKCSFEVLRYVNYEVAHFFQFIYYIHVVNACLIVLFVFFDVFYFCVSEQIAQAIDAVFGIVGIRYFN